MAGAVSPDALFGSTSWTDWIEHFEAVSMLNGWDDAAKLRWLPVRLSGKAQTAWKRLSPERGESRLRGGELGKIWRKALNLRVSVRCILSNCRREGERRRPAATSRTSCGPAGR